MNARKGGGQVCGRVGMGSQAFVERGRDREREREEPVTFEGLFQLACRVKSFF